MPIGEDEFDIPNALPRRPTKEGWHEAASEGRVAAETTRIEELGRLGRSPTPPATWDFHEAYNDLPWNIEAKTTRSLLEAAEGGKLPGVPRAVTHELDEAGFTIKELGDVEDARKMAQEVAVAPAGVLAEPVPVPRLSMFDTIDVPPGHVGWSTSGTTHVLSDGSTVLAAATVDLEQNVFRINLAPNLTEFERNQAGRQIRQLLDNQFNKGKLKGKLNNTGMQELKAMGLDRETSDHVQTYLRRKLGTLDDATQEFLAKEPAEIFQGRLFWDDFVDKYEKVVAHTVGLINAQGDLITEAERGVLFADDVTFKMLSDLDKAARKAGDAGYDLAVEIMRDTREYTGVKVKGFVDVGVFDMAGPAVEGLHIQEEMAQFLALGARNSAMLNTPQGIAAAKAASNNALKWWRAMATLPRPAFHTRNLVGGSWMNHIYGVRAQTMRRVSNNGIKFRNGLKKAINDDGVTDILEHALLSLPKRERAVWRAAWNENVTAGFATTELPGVLADKTKSGILAMANATDVENFVLTRAGGKVMESVEDFLRMSMFTEYFDEAVEGSAKAAADMVNAVHFDYSNLTPLETRLKSIIPFFVWQRNNIPLQIRTAIENPRSLQRYGAMMQRP
jgi:hypothetical protein